MTGSNDASCRVGGESDMLDNSQTVPRRSSRQYAGKHSNLNRLPASAAAHALPCQEIDANDELFPNGTYCEHKYNDEILANITETQLIMVKLMSGSRLNSC